MPASSRPFSLLFFARSSNLAKHLGGLKGGFITCIVQGDDGQDALEGRLLLGYGDMGPTQRGGRRWTEGVLSRGRRRRASVYKNKRRLYSKSIANLFYVYVFKGRLSG